MLILILLKYFEKYRAFMELLNIYLTKHFILALLHNSDNEKYGSINIIDEESNICIFPKYLNISFKKQCENLINKSIQDFFTQDKTILQINNRPCIFKNGDNIVIFRENTDSICKIMQNKKWLNDTINWYFYPCCSL